MCLPGSHNGAFTAWIAFTQVVSLVVADLDVKASLSKHAKAKNSVVARTSYTWPLFEVRFTAEVIPYQQHWKRITSVER